MHSYAKIGPLILIWKLFWFFQAQAVSNVLLAVPFFIITANEKSEIALLEYIGAGIWLIALTGEAIADWQLDQFKKDPANKGKVCNKGLWNYSRHPNYFFEWLIWVGYFVFALASPYGFIAITKSGYYFVPAPECHRHTGDRRTIRSFER
jgi:steroid 5-alpha reductase family enzyme